MATDERFEYADGRRVSAAPSKHWLYKPHILLLAGKWQFIRNYADEREAVAASKYCTMRNRKEGRL